MGTAFDAFQNLLFFTLNFELASVGPQLGRTQLNHQALCTHRAAANVQRVVAVTMT